MASESRGHRLIFVGGSPRSGTTLVQNMLDSHSRISGTPEFLVIPKITELRDQMHEYIDREWIDEVCSHDQVDQSIADLIENWLIPFADKHDVEFVSEKTPENVLGFTALLALFPCARFINVVRDPRAVVASMLQGTKRAKEKGEPTLSFARTFRRAVGHVKKCVEAGFEASDSAPERVHTLVYEDLVRNPKNESQHLCRFLELDWEDSMLYPSRVKHAGEKALCHGIWYDRASYNRDPQTTEIDKWKKQLNFVQRAAIATAFSDIPKLHELGVDLAPNGVLASSGVAFLLFIRKLRDSLGTLRRTGISRSLPSAASAAK